MKKHIILPLLACLALFMACTDDLENPVLDISVDTANAVGEEDGIPVFKTGSDVKFLLNDQSDIITFYSGEVGSEYRYKDRTELGGEATPSLYFKTMLQYGNKFNSLFVMLSTDFAGFTSDKETDAQNISNATWINITDLCNLPTTKNAPNNETETPLIDLSDYKGKNLFIAFRFNCTNGEESTFTVSNFRIFNESEGSQFIISETGTAGWIAYDFHATGTQDPYSTNGGVTSGTITNKTWNTTKAVSEDKISVGGSNTSENDDWLISSPINVSTISPDKGTGIKGFGDVRLKTYSYTYNTAGVYTVTFVGFNSYMDDKKLVLKEIKIKIID